MFAHVGLLGGILGQLGCILAPSWRYFFSSVGRDAARTSKTTPRHWFFMILGPILVYFLSVFQSIFNDFGINFEAKFKIIFVCYRLCYLHLFPYLFIFVFCSIFSYYVSSVFCERSAQASEASVAREAIQTHAQFCPILKHVFVFVFLCVLLSVYLFLSGIFVLLCICRVYSSTRVFKLQLIRASRSFVSQVYVRSFFDFCSVMLAYLGAFGCHVGSRCRQVGSRWFNIAPRWVNIAPRCANIAQHGLQMPPDGLLGPPKTLKNH